MTNQVLNSNLNCTSEKELKKRNFLTRTKASIFIVFYFLIIVTLTFCCDPQCYFMRALSLNKWYPFIFYLAFFLSTIWLNYFVAIEINNCFIGYKKTRNDVILFFILLFFELSTIWILPLVSYEFIILNSIFIQIIFISLVFASTFLIFICAIIYFRLNQILVTKTKLLGSLIVILIHLTFVATNYLILTKSWFALVMLVFIPCINDVFAYLGGVFYGKHKMTPRLSPKKTWEGFSTGLVATLIVSITLIFTLYFTNNSSTNIHYSLIGSFIGWQWFDLNSVNILIEDVTHWYWLIVLCVACIIIAIVSVYGDLLFSYFKRINQIKDFSNLIPGHGGILDRIDSFSLVSVSYFILSMIFCLCFNGFSNDSFLMSHFRFV